MTERERLLGQKPMVPLFMKLAVPAMIGMLVQAFYSLADRYFIGNIAGYGKYAIGGIGVAMPIAFILMGISMLFGIGGAANISIALGEKKYQKAEQVLANALSMLLCVSFIVNIVFFIFSVPLLKAYGATTQTLPYANDYIRIILVGNFWNTFAFAMNHLIRSEGNSKRAMFSMLIGAGTNLILDPIFIFVLDMGIQGAAVATIIAQFLSFLWGISYYLSGKNIVKLHWRAFRWRTPILGAIVAIGFSPFFIQVAGSLVSGILNNALKMTSGSLAQGAYTIINAVAMIFFMPVFGMSQALQPIVGYNYGAKQYNRVRSAVKVGFIAATTSMLLGWICIMFFSPQIVSFMNQDPVLGEITVHGIRIYLFAIPIVGIQIITSTFFQAINKAKQAFILSVSRQIMFLIPLLFILPPRFGIDGVWFSMPIADVIAFVLTIAMLRYQYKRMPL